MLRINHVSKSYASSGVKAVDDICLKVERGEIFGFLGPNGAGKSTTIKMITGILNVDRGQITVNGFDVTRNPIEAKLSIGYVSDNHEVYERLTGYEFLSFIGNVYRMPAEDCRRLAAEYCEAFGLKEAVSKQISTYSHGMKQKLMIISALIHDPKLWILDEPMTGLDPQSSYELKQLMRKHADKGNTVFFSSHVIEVVEKVCDRVGIITKGKMARVGALDELKSKDGESLESIFFDTVNNRRSDTL